MGVYRKKEKDELTAERRRGTQTFFFQIYVEAERIGLGSAFFCVVLRLKYAVNFK